MTFVAGPARSNARMTNSSWYHLCKSHLRRIKNGLILSFRPGSVRNRGQRSTATACISMNIPPLLPSRPIPPSDLAARVERTTCDMNPRLISSTPLMAVGVVTPTLAWVRPRFSSFTFPKYVANSHRDCQLFAQGLRNFFAPATIMSCDVFAFRATATQSLWAQNTPGSRRGTSDMWYFVFLVPPTSCLHIIQLGNWLSFMRTKKPAYRRARFRIDVSRLSRL